MTQRSCGWMSGPKDAAVQVPAIKWWFAISRDLLAAHQRRRNCKKRPPVGCGLVPSFNSPLAKSSDKP